MRYHVFIEGSRDVSPAGLDVLAAALGQRYGMSPPAVVRRLKEGRFCARASLDLAAAQRLVGELEALGAHASLVGDGAPTPLGPRYESGLAAAYGGGGPRPDAPLSLGPLDGGARTDTGWQLTSVDGGHSDGAPAMGSSGPAQATTLPGMPPPPTSALPPREGPPPVPARPARSTPQNGSPPPTIFQPPAAAPPPAVERDPFEPDPASNALPELADMPTRVMPARPSDSSPPPDASASPPRAPASSPRPSASSPPPRASASSSPPPRVAGATFRSPPMGLREQLADSPRARFVAGLALAFVVGLLPALGFAWSRADSAYDDIRAELQADYDAADSHERWSALAAVRDDAMALARARQQRLAISSCLLWLAAASAVAFVWFRLIDWPQPQPDDRP